MDQFTQHTSHPSVEDAQPRYRMGFLWSVCLAAALGGLLFGYDWVVVGGAKPLFIRYFGVEESAGLVLAQAVNWAIACNLPADFTDEQIIHSWYGQVG